LLISTNTGLYSARLDKPRYSLHEAVRFFVKSGFEALDVNFAATIYTAENCRDTILDGDWESKLDAVLKAATENGIAILSSHTPFISGNAPHNAQRYEYTMAMATCSILPIVVFFIACQKHFVEGIATAGLKV
jgi:hypothetical protein